MHRLHRRAFRLSLDRDQLTRASYAYFALWGWFLYSFGPTVPLLRHDQGTTRAVAGLHGTALAVGAMLSALLTVPLARRYGRRRVVLIACTVISLGVIALISVHGPALTVPAVLVIGLGGALGLNAANPILSDHHRELGPGAIGEANAIAAAGGIVGPLVVGAAVAIGLGWQGALAVTVPLAAVAALLFRRAPQPAEPDVHPTPPDRGVPTSAFWLAWLVMVACVAVEFCCTFWAADHLRSHVGMSAGAASAALSALLVGMTVGRTCAVPLTARFAVRRLLTAAILVALLGWAVFWLARSAPLAVLGLGILGLGLSLQFPLSLVRTMQASGGRPDTANALASLGTGLASGIAPFALGALADHVGTHRGFLLVPALLIVAGLLLGVGRRTAEGRATTPRATPAG